ncbi:hypothetical protein LMH87_011187 [Akanthomyces muscarius]|uniref:Secreted protein n=1 Tax=Akanthomyces muscarius TaxID=2231603 RepID=A0A9W8QAT8_AKAMU|nr:hypothetical protein LMH87_011187 [Akanthomyces muscarius]KAJ4150437.1 hypothetical protein LMH87_011187 [Akanthomyces muscarius]
MAMTRRASHQPLVTLLGVASACGDPGDIDNTQTVGNPIGQFSDRHDLGVARQLKGQWHGILRRRAGEAGLLDLAESVIVETNCDAVHRARFYHLYPSQYIL